MSTTVCLDERIIFEENVECEYTMQAHSQVGEDYCNDALPESRSLPSV
jgi:hypothetical protein